eukprot:TRINITY_DN47306_c0_g1_i1.p1 TRINITY_DN47306_c0_g1~~TRINITY_DN47306_c0_g1_i1.p1  ORF type:complete len:989 (+),score=309.47 TRINITY_DN47306_c0_g1_i1:48-2969(+)
MATRNAAPPGYPRQGQGGVTHLAAALLGRQTAFPIPSSPAHSGSQPRLRLPQLPTAGELRKQSEARGSARPRRPRAARCTSSSYSQPPASPGALPSPQLPVLPPTIVQAAPAAHPVRAAPGPPDSARGDLADADIDHDAQGFDKLQRTLGWVVAKVEESRKRHGGRRSGTTLSEAWDEVSHWLARYFDDAEVTASAQCISDIIVGSKSDTASFSQPCNPQAYHACMGLEHLLRAAVRAHPGLAPLATMIREDLHACLYCTSAPVPPAPFGGDEVVLAPKQLLAPFQGRRTYFQAVRMLSKRLGAQKGDMMAAGQMHSRAVGGVERVALYWKRHLTGVILRGWRTHILRTKEQAAAREVAAELQRVKAELAQVQQDALRRIAAAEHRRKKAEEQHAKLKHETDALTNATLSERDKVQKYQQEISDLREQLLQVQEEVRTRRLEAAEEFRQLANALKVAQKMLVGSTFEKEQRKRVKSLLDRPAVDSQSLMDWVNLCITEEMKDRKIRGAPDTAELFLSDFCQGARAVRTYWVVLAFMSPYHVKDDELRKALRGHDMILIAERLLLKLEEMGIATTVRREDLVGDSNPEQHEVFVSELFSRFSGAAKGTVEFRGREQRASSLIPEDDDEPHPTAQELVQSVREDNAATAVWFGVANKIQKTVWNRVSDVMKTGNSATLSAAEQKDYPAYTELRGGGEAVTDLFDEDEEAPQGMQQEVAEVEELLQRFYRKLRKVFAFYAGMDGSKGNLSLDEFWRMVSDARIADKTFTREALRKIFTVLGSTALPSEPGEAVGSLDPEMWIAALLRIATAKFKKSLGTTADKLRLLLEKHLLMYCCGGEGDDFKQQMYQSTVQEILARNKPKLKKIFKHYSSQDKQGFTQEVHEMSQQDFMRMIREINALDATLTFHALEAMFRQMLNETTTNMLYHEFLEAVCGVAVYKFPNPFTPLPQKLHSFLEQWMFPQLSRKIKITATCA